MLFPRAPSLLTHLFVVIFLFLEKKKTFFSAGTRTFVHEKIYDAFVAEATKLARERKVGSPFDANIQQGL